MATDWSSSGIGSTVKWCHIEGQEASDWPSSGTGLTVKWFGIDSQVVSHWHHYDESQVATIGLQVVWDRQSSGITLAVL